ncbi:TetR family transcriptional regulator [Actinosynnema sp. NPDC050801]|uniref:TetR family transcriptional regulator n=1 Tax=unclassified Actinosynnema TaxID=2637065 RepID=UPI0033C85C00
MAWNTEETRRRLKEAAVVEFAAHGLAGTRVERIAARAGVNKERLYNYFGDKDRLFHAVLSDELAKIAAAVPLDGLRDVGEYAGRCFDYHLAHPHLVRLLQWEALAYGDGAVPDEEGRVAHYRRKVEAFRAAQADGVVDASPEAADLVFTVMSLAAWWFAVPQVARMVTGPDDVERRRAVVVDAARRLAANSHVG